MDFEKQLKSTNSLLDSVQAATNLKAIALFAGTIIGAILITAIGMATGAFLLVGLFGLISIIILFYGMNAVGMLLFHEAKGVSLTLGEAIALSLRSSHRIIAIAFLTGLIALAAVVILSIVLVVCKIPFIGPVLYTVVFPLAAIAMGILLFSLYYVFIPLSACAVWNGQGVFASIKTLYAIIRHRLIQVLIQEIVLMVIIFVAMLIIGTILAFGFVMVSSMSTAILPDVMGGLMGMSSGRMGGGSGYVLAGMVGASLLVALASIIPSLIGTKGFCHIFINAVESLKDVNSDADAELFSKIKSKAATVAASTKESVQKAAEKTKNAAAAASAAANAAAASKATANAADAAPAPEAQADHPAVVQAPAPSANHACPHCHAPAAADDKFCGECGTKI